MASEIKYSILVVEDEVINQLYLSTVLKKQFIAHVAGNASTALTILDKEEIDLILMDISLRGGKSGIELTKELRNLPKYKKTPIVAITGHIVESELQKTIDAGCNTCIKKPFNKTVLLNTIHKYLEPLNS